MLAPINTKDMNSFPSQPRKSRDVRTRSQSLDDSEITRSVKRSHNTVAQKSSQPSVKLKSAFVHSVSLSKPFHIRNGYDIDDDSCYHFRIFILSLPSITDKTRSTMKKIQ
uniref:Ovule protein n=1 Tax=Elaeophora elaphi TaxID=1147741 RepID=A0A0R3RHS0_9BILA